ncbi:MAG: hypothetical protein K1X64_22245 [Myxococcaceae bacterium]|nr:hypothetical protein [Myxococcaceae bacterium]
MRALAGWALVAAVGVGCYLAEPAPQPEPGNESLGNPAGFPCDVGNVVSRRCLTCHNASSGRLLLTTPENFLAKRETVLARIHDAAQPMPPQGALPADELTVLETWLKAGAPQAACENKVTDAGMTVELDAGTPGEGLPCDVEALLASKCRTCHGARLSGNAPMPLVTRDQFLAPSSVAGLSQGALSVQRMKKVQAPMPPSGVLPSSDVAVLENWVNAGMPVGNCSAPDAGPSPFDVPPQCTSATYTGNTENQYMNPGLACVSCHAQKNAEEGKEELPEGIAGTAYPSAHEPDHCDGAKGAATVVITDAAGRVFRLPVNAKGNFYLYASRSGLSVPYRARVETANGVREMVTPQESGDCNACHTQNGTHGAPGRILLP